LEDLLAHIDAPELWELNINFFNQIDFHTPQLVQFICRTPNLGALNEARLCFGIDAAGFYLSSPSVDGVLDLKVSCRELDWQLSFLEQYCTLFLPSTSALEDLYIYKWEDSKPDWKDNAENAPWLTLLHPFTTVKNLYLSKDLAPRVLPALQELVGGRTTEVLPTLEDIHLEEIRPPVPVREAIDTIDAARELSGHPVTISFWKRPWN
jgi:hypothetical protein